MGLDSVELVMAIEEEFGVEIADGDVGQIFTVGQMYDYLRTTLRSTPPVNCITQRMFYRVRRALSQNYGLARHSIKLDARLKDLVPGQELDLGVN